MLTIEYLNLKNVLAWRSRLNQLEKKKKKTPQSCAEWITKGLSLVNQAAIVKIKLWHFSGLPDKPMHTSVLHELCLKYFIIAVILETSKHFFLNKRVHVFQIVMIIMIMCSPSKCLKCKPRTTNYKQDTRWFSMWVTLKMVTYLS